MTFTARERSVLFRFSLYGFLKNQQYYDMFLVLAFRERGLSFFEIGVLFGFRALCVNLFEIPSGAVADLYGRRIAMIVSFLAYIFSFAVFGASGTFWHLFVAMFFFAIGQAFRTGTHKAMIFDWLRANGREAERTRVYGFTRSWSKLGSALSVVIATAVVIYCMRYKYLFWLCIPPYCLNILNFLGYPAEAEGEKTAPRKPRRVHGHVWRALKQAWHHRRQRRLLLEAMGFEGGFKAGKDYLQPVLEAAAIGLPFLLGVDDIRRTAVLVGLTYTALHLASSAASRHAHRMVDRCGGENQAARCLWWAALVLYAGLAATLYSQRFWLAIPIFVTLYIIQNLWRPALVSRLNACSDAQLGATTLSIESQGQSFFLMLIAPALGWSVDHLGLWPVGVLGAALAAMALVGGRGAVSEPG